MTRTGFSWCREGTFLLDVHWGHPPTPDLVSSQDWAWRGQYGNLPPRKGKWVHFLPSTHQTSRSSSQALLGNSRFHGLRPTPGLYVPTNLGSKRSMVALAGMALVGAPTCTLTDCGSIPGQGTCLDGQFDPQWVCREAVNRCFSLSFSLPLSLKSINIFLKIKKKGAWCPESRCLVCGCWGPRVCYSQRRGLRGTRRSSFAQAEQVCSMYFSGCVSFRR